jgi:hypothetical protein
LSKDTEALPTHYRWNSIAFLVDSICFGGVVLTLIDPTSVLPAFVRQLTDSEFVVGLISAIFRGGWLLPQLVAGRLMLGWTGSSMGHSTGIVGQAGPQPHSYAGPVFYLHRPICGL